MAFLPFRSPTTLGVFGCTQAGKSSFVKKLLSNASDMFTIKPKWMLYCYGVEPANMDELSSTIEGLVFNEGLPSEELINEKTATREHGIIVLDDLMGAVMKSSKAESLFIMGSHHKKLTVVLVAQNLFYQGKASRTISLNMHYMILYRNLRDKSQIKCLAQQIFPGQVRDFMEVYNDIHMEPFNYLVVDLHPHTDGEYRLRTHIFKGETPIIYKLD